MPREKMKRRKAKMNKRKNSIGIQATGHHILICPDEVAEKTKGGIILAQETRQQEQRAATQGVIINIGPTAWVDFGDGEPWAKEGDYVSFAKFAGIEIVGKNGQRYILLNDQDILAVLTKNND